MSSTTVCLTRRSQSMNPMMHSAVSPCRKIRSPARGSLMPPSLRGAIRAASDRIFLHGLTAECIIGFIDWERRVRQTVVLDIELPVDCTRAATSDEVAATLDYKRVAKRVLAYVAASEFKLVETLAHRVALLILEEFAVDWVRISLNKPGAVRHSRDVGVVIERTRADLASAAPPPADRT